MTRIAQTFSKLKAEDKKAFVAFITAGDPNYNTSLEILKKLPDSGVDVIELGVPFLDPAGDGPTIELASKRAIQNGMTLKKALLMVKEFRESNQTTPLILMGYFNPILKYGVENFARDAAESGVDGALIVDLPPEEDEDFRKLLKNKNLDFIRLISPISSEERIKKIVNNSSGFLYLISVLGITGTKSALPEDNEKQIAAIRKFSDLPIALGFGIKTPGQAADMSKINIDGIVIGSSLVEIIANGLENNSTKITEDLIAKSKEFAEAIRK